MNQYFVRTVCAAAAALLAAGSSVSAGADKSLAVGAAKSAAAERLGIQRVGAKAIVKPATLRIDPRLQGRSGEIQVWVQLDQPSLAKTRAALARSTGAARVRAAHDATAVRAAMKAQRASLVSQQSSAAQRLKGMGAQVLGQVKVAHNAIAVRVNANQLAAIASMPGVVRVRPVIDYKLDLSETVPYIGASAVQALGFDGSGVTVAVLDSGVDYTHKNLGGGGTPADYTAAYGSATTDPANTTRDGLFPTAKVIAGMDFVGEAWPNGPVVIDDDPIDFEGHGTHVADIIAGASLDGTHKGVAPGATLVSAKVCSAVASSCNGVALLQGMDFALDPNGDGDLSDAVDVINMSLGSSYGQIEDDLTLASSNAVEFGTLVVASAGNSADRPFITGSPSIAPGALGVAQTQVPSAVTIPAVVNSPAAIAGVYGNTATVDWAPIGAGVTGDVKTAVSGGGVDNLACAPLPAGSLSGKIALVDRGNCAVSIKVDYAARAGATGFLLGLSAAGDAVTFSFGGPDDFMPVPTLVIQQSLASAIKAQIAAGETVNVSISPAGALPLVGSMVGSSSRGPSYSLQTIKPEIGAPGASVSAVAGSGDGMQAFGGTSGAAPMVSGAAALLVQAHPTRSALQIKAMLMNSAETTIYTNPAVLPGQLAPITRIGGGEVRVDRAVALEASAWDVSAKSAALSFGVVEADGREVVQRTLTVENFGTTTKRFSLTPSFRFADDEASGAVKIIAPGSVVVPAGGSSEVKVTMVIDGTKLPAWTLNGGANGGNGALLDAVEVDGYLTLTRDAEKLTVPWQVLPRKAASLRVVRGSQIGDSDVTLVNTSANPGAFDIFSLTGSSPQLPGPLPGPGDNAAVIDLKSVGARYVADCGVTGGCLQFAISTYGRRSHPNYPAVFELGLDTDGDGAPDWYVFNQENGGFGATGQNLTFFQPAAGGSASAYFYTDADLVSGSVILTVPMANLGLAPESTFGFYALAADNYFTGAVTDVIEGMAFTPGAPAYSAPLAGTAAQGLLQVPFTRTAVPAGTSSETGLLMMYRRSAGNESQEVRLR